MKTRPAPMQVEELLTRIVPSVNPAPAVDTPSPKTSAFHTLSPQALLPSNLSLPGVDLQDWQKTTTSGTVQAESQVVGQGRGVYISRTTGVDAGPTVTLSGTATLDGVPGTSVLSGSVQSVGSVAQGSAYGLLTLSHGSDLLQIELTGPVQDASAPLPTTFTSSVTQATGVYQFLSGKQTVELTLGTGMANAGTGVGLGTHGSFRLLFGTLPRLLAGSLSGTWTAPMVEPLAETKGPIAPPGPVPFPGFGMPDSLQGSGTLAGIGSVTFSGSVEPVWFIVKGRATGTLTFTQTDGQFTVQLTGPVQDGFAALPTTFGYKVTAATGKDASLLGQAGSLTLQLAPPMAQPADGFLLGPSGTFTLDFLPLSGEGQGTLSRMGGPEGGSKHFLQGVVTVDGLGKETLTGDLRWEGSLARGLLKLSDGGKSITLEVTGNKPTSADPSTTLTWKVVDATGAYRRFLYHKGSLELKLTGTKGHEEESFDLKFLA